MRKQKGFSLIELLIVVAIILIIAAIAIPNLMRARISANEASAASGVRTINTGEVSYWTNWPAIGFSVALADLGDNAGTCSAAVPTATNACVVDVVLAANGNPAGSGKSGYSYTYISAVGVAGPQHVTYQVAANPLSLNQSGVKGFCALQDAVVRFQNPGPIALAACTPAISPLQ